MPRLLRKNRESIVGRGSVAVARPPPAGRITAAWRAGGADSPAPAELLRVLIVDDNRDAADTLSILVKKWGHAPRVAYDGVAALAMASDTFDVLFIDIGMPKMDGFQLARHLRRQIRFTDALLVAITGWADEAHRRLWEDAFDYYLIKPVEPSALEKLLRDQARLIWSRISGEETGDNDMPGESLHGALPINQQLCPTLTKETSTCYA